jgi:cytochrome b6-f complex iron-sulfur subunit
MADKKKMSVADILAAARKGTAGGESQPAPAGGDAAPAAAESTPPEVAATNESAPAEKAAPKPKPAAPAAGGKMSVAEILAAARAKKEGGEPADAPKPTAKPAAAEKPATEKPAAKPKVDRPAAAAATSAVRDTSSILAAARGATKPGPITKSEAAAKLAPAAPATAKKEKEAVTLPPMPTKPDYAKPKAKEPVAAGEDRRFFLGVLFGSFMGAGFTSLAAASGLFTFALARFMFPNVLTEPPSKFKIGFPSDFAPGAVDEKFKAQFGIWPVNTEYKGLRQMVALKTVCTHLGCTPNWLEAEQKFKCPCHGSGFYKDGINFEGPAPRPLERYAIRLADDGQLEVDKSRTFQEELGQWSDPACFVPV